ncbi:MAG: hypothetical protein ABIH83_00730 [Candidatus Micrarchaeota archaeon]
MTIANRTDSSNNVLVALDEKYSEIPKYARIFLITTIIFFIFLMAGFARYDIDIWKMAAVYLFLLISVSISYFLVSIKIERELNLGRAILRAVQLVVFIILIAFNYTLLTEVYKTVSEGGEPPWFWTILGFFVFNTLFAGTIWGISYGLKWAEKKIAERKKQKSTEGSKGRY